MTLINMDISDKKLFGSRSPRGYTKPGLYDGDGKWLGAPYPFPEFQAGEPIRMAGITTNSDGSPRWMTQAEFDNFSDQKTHL